MTHFYSDYQWSIRVHGDTAAVFKGQFTPQINHELISVSCICLTHFAFRTCGNIQPQATFTTFQDFTNNHNFPCVSHNWKTDLSVFRFPGTRGNPELTAELRLVVNLWHEAALRAPAGQIYHLEICSSVLQPGQRRLHGEALGAAAAVRRLLPLGDFEGRRHAVDRAETAPSHLQGSDALNHQPVHNHVKTVQIYKAIT